LAYYVDIVRQYLRNILNNDRYSSVGAGALSDGLWRRASAAGASTPLEKRAFGIADDMQVFFFPFLHQQKHHSNLHVLDKTVMEPGCLLHTWHLFHFAKQELWMAFPCR